MISIPGKFFESVIPYGWRWCFGHKIDYLTFSKETLNFEEHQKCITGSRVTAIFLVGWILDIGGASAVEGLPSTRLPRLVFFTDSVLWYFPLTRPLCFFFRPLICPQMTWSHWFPTPPDCPCVEPSKQGDVPNCMRGSSKLSVLDCLRIEP